MADSVRLVEVKLDESTTVLAQVSGEASTTGVNVEDLPSADSIIETIRKVATALLAAGDALGWSKTTVEFSVGIEAKSGVPFLAEGKATGSLGVTMEFEKPKSDQPKAA